MSTRWGILQLALAAALGHAGVAGAAATCEPFDGLQSDRVARERGARGLEVTEYFPGAYRVTRCDANGRPQRAMTVARISTPTGVQPFVPIEEQAPGVTVYLLYGDPAERTWATRWLEHGSQATARAIAPTAPVPRDLDRPPARASDDSCSNGQFVQRNRWSVRRYGYRANARSMSNAFRTAIIAGHHAWDRTRNSCRYRDQNNITSRYLGNRSGTIHTRADGRSMVDFGRLKGVCGTPATLACTWTFTSASLGGQISETDQRYGTGWPWSTSGRAGTYDVESAAAHETGHSIGLGHASSSRFLTMYHQICSGCIRGRTLARGDVRGLRALYPPG